MNIKNTLILTLSLLSLTAAQAAAPVNDSILKPIKLSGLYSTHPVQDLSLATADVMDPMIAGTSAGKTLWYSFPHHPTSGMLQITVTSNTGVGTASLFSAEDPENPRGSLRQETNVAFTTGQTISVSASYFGKPLFLMLAGTGQISVTHRLIVASYDFPQIAYALSGEYGTVYIDNSAASNTADEPALPPGAGAMTNIVWLKWTPAFSGMAYFDTNFSYSGGSPTYSHYSPPLLHDTQIALYAAQSGGGPTGLTPISFDDGSGYGGNNSRLGLVLNSGTTYYIAVGTRSGAPGDLILNYHRSTTPSEIYFPSSDQGPSAEGAASHPIIARRRYASSGTASCTLTTSNNTATAGADYTSLSTTVNFAAPTSGSSAWQVTTPVTLLQDSLDEARFEKVNIALSSPSGAVLDTSSGFFFIMDDESGSDLGLALSGIPSRVREGDGQIAIRVSRLGVEDSSYIDLIQTAGGGTASWGEDFSLINSTLRGPNSATDIYVEPKNDNIFEGEETVLVYVNGGYNLYYSMIIEDDDLYIPVAGKLTTSLSYAGNKRRAVLYSTISSLGVVSGKLIIPGQTLAFTGKLDLRGKLTVALAPKGRGIFYLTLAAQDAQGHMKMSLLDSMTNGLSSSEALIQNYAPKTNPCPLAGNYTVRHGGINDGVNTVACSGAASCMIDASGNARFVGKLFDGTSYTVAGYVDGEAQVGAIAPLYAGLGYIGYSGFMPLAPGSVSSLLIGLNRPARANDPAKFGPAAFEQPSHCARYTPPASGARALDAWAAGTGKATLNGAPLAMTLTKALTISTKNVIAAPVDAENLKITVMPATGMFSGSFVLPSTTKKLTIFGTLTDLPGMNGLGIGYFFDGKQGGTITIGQP